MRGWITEMTNEQEILDKLNAVEVSSVGLAELAHNLASEENDSLQIDLSILENAPQGASVISDLLEHSSKEKLTLVLQNFRLREKFAERDDIKILLEGIKKSHVTSVSIKGIYLGIKGFNALNEALTNYGIRHLKLETTDLSEQADFLAIALEDSLLSSLELPANQLNNACLETLGDAIGHLTELEHLNLGKNIYLAGFENILTQLPETLKTLNLSETKSPRHDMVFLAERLKALPQLAQLDLSLCELSEESLITLSEVLPETKIMDLNLSYNPLTEGGVKALIEAMSNPDSILFKTHLTDEYNDLPPQDIAAIKQLEASNRAKIDNAYANEIKEYMELRSVSGDTKEIRQKIKDSVSLDDMRKTGLLFLAAKAGKIDAVYQRLHELHETLRADDYFIKDTYGSPLLTLIGNAKQLAVAFSAENWTNAKEMQSVYDALNTRQKTQLNGKKGRPNFQDLKNDVMKNAASVPKHPTVMS